MPNAIESIIDSNSTYAYAFMTRDREYGHMSVNIRLGEPEFGRNVGKLAITCQIGSYDGNFEQSSKTYAWSFGLNSHGDALKLPELERAVKIMKKVDRYLTKIEAEYGQPKSYAEHCQRILLGSGVTALITEPNDGWANGGLMADKKLFTIGARSMCRLIEMEANLCTAFARKAA